MHAVVVRPLEDGGESATGERTLKAVTQREIARLRFALLGQFALTNFQNRIVIVSLYFKKSVILNSIIQTALHTVLNYLPRNGIKLFISRVKLIGMKLFCTMYIKSIQMKSLELIAAFHVDSIAR